MKLKYEFFYNWDYAQEHNPTLMGFGLSGGFGCIRASMLKAVKGGDRVKAEACFWSLIVQSLVEARLEEEIIGVGTLDELLECWFEHLQGPDSNEHEAHFMRLTQEGSQWQDIYDDFQTKHKDD